MRENIESKQLDLKVPGKEVLPLLNIRSLHQIWRDNESLLIQHISETGAMNIPRLGTHGSTAERVKDLLKINPTMWIFWNYKKFSTASEALRNLYILAFSGARFSFLRGHSQCDIKGEAGMVFYQLSDTRPKSDFFDSNGSPLTSWRHTAAEDMFLLPLPYFCRKPDSDETASFYEYMQEKLDNESEEAFFDIHQDPGQIVAYNTFTPKEDETRTVFFEHDVPMQLLLDHDPDPVIDGYRVEILKRLFCQNLVSIMLQNL